MAERPVRFPWALSVITALLLCLLIGLGAWQVQRLQWKAGLIAQADQAAIAAPAPLAEALASDNPEFRKVALSCAGLASAPYVELQSIHQGQAGVRLISVCSTAGSGPTLLIDRGFVADGVPERPPVTPSNQAVKVIAEIRATPAPGPLAVPPQAGRFYARDNAAMAKALGVEGAASPWTLFALTSSNPNWAGLRPSAPPAAFSNNHLGYAITWFGLALALIGFYIALLRRNLRQRRLPDQRPSTGEPTP